MAIEAFPDLTGYAPKSEAWHAYDTATYCGCDDCHCPVGTGATADEAIADLLEQLEGRRATAVGWRRGCW
jgi:hypothetical protein